VSPRTCSSKQLCCQQECEVAGQLTCATDNPINCDKLPPVGTCWECSNEYQERCRDANLDGCLEWTDRTKCATGYACVYDYGLSCTKDPSKPLKGCQKQ
jgi:hypothetical protein